MLCAEWCFPLTLTLSREGRGKNIARAMRTERLRSLEGWGEGKKCTNP